MLDQESFQAEGTACAKELKFEAHSVLGELPVQEGESWREVNKAGELDAAEHEGPYLSCIGIWTLYFSHWGPIEDFGAVEYNTIIFAF